MLLSVSNVAKSFGVQEVFRDISFSVDKGEKVGLVGANGSGKTTLLRCVLEEGYTDAGSVRFAKALRVGYVEQGFGSLGEGTLWEYMEGSCKDIVELAQRLESLRQAQGRATGQEQKELLASYARCEAEFESVDGYHYEQNIRKILLGLGFPEESWGKKVTEFSGGQKTRILLAGALVNSPELLILDEPTNHLDIVMTEWLEEYLREFRGGLLTVSHDRYFLDKVATRMLEMEGGRLIPYKGNYTHYLEQKEIRTATLESAYASQQEYIQRTEAYIRRFKAGIKSKMARGRQSQLDRLERMEAPVHDEEFDLRLPKAAESAERVIMLDDLAVGYPGQQPLLAGMDLLIKRGEKVAILGANGTGKTTLLKTVLGEIPPKAGKVRIGNRVKIGYFSQSYERLKPQQTIMDNFLTEYGLTDQETRNLLGGMLFRGDEVFKEIGTLSGGQKARLVLLKLVLDGANCLLLDEPTNHLDIPAKEAVEAALEVFDGTVLLVTHDRYLVNEVADRVWELREGQIHDYRGNFDYFLQQREREEASKGVPYSSGKENKKETVAVQVKESAAARERSYSAQEAEKLLPTVELRIREQEALLKILEKKMADPANHASLEDSEALAGEYNEIQQVIDGLMAKWEKLMEAMENG